MKYFIPIIVFIALCTGWYIRPVLERSENGELPTIRQMQTRLGCKKIDGKLGPCWKDSETQTEWQMAWQKENPGKLMY